MAIADAFFEENFLDIFEQAAAIRPSTREELQVHVAACYGYEFPDTPVCAGHVSPMQVLWELFSDAYPHLLVVGSRESGKTLIFAFAEHLLMRWNGDEIFHGAGIYPQAKRCFAYVQKTATGKERPYFSREVTKCVEDEVRLVGPSGREGKLEIKSATIEQLNGPHPRVVMLDEVELIEEKALNEAASLSGDTIISTQQGLIRIDAVKVGDVVDCLFEGRLARRPVVWAGRTGIGATIRINLENGRTLTLTPTHEVLTPQGWRAAQTLEIGDRIVSGLRGSDERREVELLPQTYAPKLAQDGGKTRDVCVRDANLMGCKRVQTVFPSAPQNGAGRCSERIARKLIAAVPAMRWTKVSQGQNLQPLQWQDIGGTHSLDARLYSGQSRSVASEKSRLETRASRVVSLQRTWLANVGESANREISRRPRSPRNENMRRGERLVLSPFAEANRGRRCTHELAEDGRLSSRHLVGCAGAVLGHDVNESIRIIGIAAGPTIPVFDVGVQEAHNFVAEGVVVHNSMPQRMFGRPPALHYTSSLKKAYGPMVKFIEEKEKRGLTERRFCVFEVIERCPPARHENGKGCLSCPLAPYCQETVRDERTGETRIADGPGRAARANGWMLIDDVIAKMRLMDIAVFRSQWLSLEPQIEGLIYPMFDANLHVVNYRYNPNLPVLAAADFGFTNPHCTLYAQQLYDEAVVVFAEDYAQGVTHTGIAMKILAKPWYANLEYIMGDPADADARATLNEAGIRNVLPADNDVQAGIDDVRWALQSADASRPPLLYFDASCVNLIREIKTYHRSDPGRDLDPTEKPRKIDDHAMDTLRYLIRRIFRARVRVTQQ